MSGTPADAIVDERADPATVAVVRDVDEVLTTTRAVRRRLDLERPVERATLEHCIELARQAPIAENQEVARFVVVQRPELRAIVADAYRRSIEEFVMAPMRASAARRAAAGKPSRTPDARTQRVMASAKHLVDHFHEVPALILAGTVDRVPPEPVGAHASAFYGSVYPAVWSLQLALRSRGLGSSITCIHLHHADDVAAALELPDEFVQVALLPVAYTVGLDFRRAPRRPAAEAVSWDTWGGV